MDKKKIKLIDSFKARTESGKIVTICVHQEFTITEEFADGGIPQEIPGNRKLSSDISDKVRMINETQYEIVLRDGSVILVNKI